MSISSDFEGHAAETDRFRSSLALKDPSAIDRPKSQLVALSSSAANVCVGAHGHECVCRHDNPPQSSTYVKCFMICLLRSHHCGKEPSDRLSALVSKCLLQKRPAKVLNLLSVMFSMVR